MSAAVRRAESECRAASKKAQTACEDAAEKCLAVANEEVDRVVVRRIDKGVETALKRREAETASQRRDLELKADEMLESLARRATDLASGRAENAAKEATEAARKCGEAIDARERAYASAAKAEAAAVEAKETKAWITHQVTGFERATEEGIATLRDQENGSVGRLMSKTEETESRVRAAAAEAEERCREAAADAKRVDATLKRIFDEAGSVESIKTREHHRGAVRATSRSAAPPPPLPPRRGGRVELGGYLASWSP